MVIHTQVITQVSDVAELIKRERFPGPFLP